MAIQVSPDEFNRALSRLNSSWRIYAPKAEYRGGRFSDTDNIIYQPIRTWQEIVWREKSHMSPNTIITPITETLFYFNQNTIQIADVDTRPMLIFARACDINAMSRLDKMYLENGNNTDYSYQLMRDNIRFVLIECETSFENCFCVSMDSHRTDNYSAAVRFSEEKALIEIKDDSLLPFFEGIGQPCDYTPEFITENQQTVVTPDQVCNDPQKIRDVVVNHPLWTTYDDRCISCGRCTTGCPTCTCYSIFDVPYEENPQHGERRRQWSSCLVPGFGDMAGGHVLRSTPGERLRYRALHKINDFKDRHGDEHMCVGCGRCEDRCPQYIKFSLIINKITDAVRVSLAEEETNQ